MKIKRTLANHVEDLLKLQKYTVTNKEFLQIYGVNGDTLFFRKTLPEKDQKAFPFGPWEERHTLAGLETVYFSFNNLPDRDDIHPWHFAKIAKWACKEALTRPAHLQLAHFQYLMEQFGFTE